MRTREFCLWVEPTVALVLLACKPCSMYCSRSFAMPYNYCLKLSSSASLCAWSTVFKQLHFLHNFLEMLWVHAKSSPKDLCRVISRLQFQGVCYVFIPNLELTQWSKFVYIVQKQSKSVLEMVEVEKFKITYFIELLSFHDFQRKWVIWDQCVVF